jgi:hypothetical protein
MAGGFRSLIGRPLGLAGTGTAGAGWRSPWLRWLGGLAASSGAAPVVIGAAALSDAALVRAASADRALTALSLEDRQG